MNTDGTELFLENQLCFPLYAASRLTTQVYNVLLKEEGLTYPQYLVLLVLWQYGSLSVNEICQKLLLESNTVTPLLKRLEEKLLLNRNRSEADERVVMVSLTEKGTMLQQRIAQIPHSVINCFKDESISLEEIITLQKTLFKLINILNKK
ncbi:MarR family winged helix-turn-helix transcriptional regulator [Flectobacillus major]|jgi:DNA-binding MarR family transcriptional regulator|uniref:MarR family winged helix-turn-helix transcriptional regulator n=1 Tax=Flectobacillus major TaxID=103 RepID=UPI000427C4A9|nr:MarR family transcriptional regulator [Flectobacillus major]